MLINDDLAVSLSKAHAWAEVEQQLGQALVLVAVLGVLVGVALYWAVDSVRRQVKP